MHPIREAPHPNLARALRGWLPNLSQLVYSSGAFGLNVFHQTLTLWLVYFYAPPPETGRPILVPMLLLGIVLTFGRVVDAVDDALIGHWSDVTHSRWGRRLPFIVGGLPLVVIAFVLLWMPPGAGGLGTVVYAFICLQGFYILSSVVSQPYEAVLPEIARTSDDRVRVSSWKVTFGFLGAAVGLVGSGLLIGTIGFPLMGLVLGLLAGASILLSTLGIRGLPRPRAEDSVGLWTALRLTASNRPFIVFVCSEVLFFLGVNMLTALMPYYVTVVLGQTEGAVSLFTAAYAVVALASLPAVSWIAAHRGKVFAYRGAMLTTGVLLPGLFFAGSLPGIPPLVQGLVYVALLGGAMSAVFVLPHPMVADIIDLEANETGLRREGMYYGIEDNLSKLAFGVSTAIFGVVLQTYGFSTEMPLGIRLIGPIAGVGVLVGLLLFNWACRFPEPRLTTAPAPG